MIKIINELSIGKRIIIVQSNVYLGKLNVLLPDSFKLKIKPDYMIYKITISGLIINDIDIYLDVS